MSIGERVRQIRKRLGMNQTEFGKRIGLKQGSLAQIERGTRSATEQTILLICEKYNVDKRWLTEGCGEMFPNIPSLDILALDNSLSEQDLSFVRSFMMLSPDARQIVRSIYTHIMPPHEYKE